MIVGTAGHIDHGKTALVKALTGIDADRLKEEKARGITIDLGYAFHPLPDGQVLGFIDVPGHENFVHNMLAGATGIDVVLFIVAADDGIKPQTREHLEIVDLLGITHGVVAITKTDRVDAARIEIVSAEIETLLADTTLAGSALFPLSSMTGDGVPALRVHLETLAARVVERAADGCFRLAVDRCFTLSGSGTVATGTVFSGEVRVGDRLRVSPSNHDVRVRSIHAQNREVDRGRAGERCALSLVGVEKKDVARGDWLLDASVHAPTSRLDVRLRLSRSAERTLKHWTPVHVHLGASDVTGRVSLLQDKNGIEAGANGLAQIVLDRPICALRGDRVVLRDQSARKTLAGGIVLDAFAPTRKVRTPERLQTLAALEQKAPGALQQLLDVTSTGVDLSWFARNFNLRPETAQSLYREMPMTVADVSGERKAFLTSRWIQLRQIMLAVLAQTHERTPEAPGLEGRRLRLLATPNLAWPIFSAMVEQLLEERLIERHGPWLHLPQHRITLTDSEQKLWHVVAPLLRATPFDPPWVRDIADTLKVPEAQVRTLLQRVTLLGDIHEIMHDRFFTQQAVTDLARIVVEIAAGTGEVRASEFRDRIGTGRKLAIRILEYFDKTSFLRRAGDSHRVRDPTLLVGKIWIAGVENASASVASISGRDSYPGGAT